MSAPPPMVGNYTVVRELGRGGMGVVYEVTHPSSPDRLALKLMHADYGEAIVRFEREMELLGRVHHAGIVRIHEVGRLPKGPYLVTELIDGEELQDIVLKRGTMGPREAARVMRDLCRAVGAVNKVGILHRDLKPQNVILRTDGTPVLLDFGLARSGDVDQLTRTGTVYGTPNYMAPEMANGMSPRELDQRVDVYGLGAILYFLLSADSPFSGETNYEVVRKVIFNEPNWPTEMGDGAALWDVCRDAMAKERDDRIPTADAMADRLQAFLDGQAKASARGGLGLPLALAGASLAVLLLVGGGFLAAKYLGGESGGGGEVVVEGPPTVTITSPADGAVVFEDRLTLEGTVDAHSATRVWVHVGEKKVRGKPGEAFKTRVQLERGVNIIAVKARVPDGETGPEVAIRVNFVNAPPWFSELPEERRAPVPLPAGVRFGSGTGEYVNQVDDSVLVWTPPATFSMGPTTTLVGAEAAQDDVAHEVTLTRGVFMGKYEVTWKQYERYCKDTGTPVPKPVFEAGEEHPVHNIGWLEARAYVQWAGLRLPTEAEWEWAARGPEGFEFPWGNEADAKKARTSSTRTVAVYELTNGASPFGCLHMCGNVAEWVQDRFSRYPAGAQIDPQGAPQGATQWRVMRNGGYSAPLYKAMKRWRVSTANPPRSDHGFRVARSAD